MTFTAVTVVRGSAPFVPFPPAPDHIPDAVTLVYKEGTSFKLPIYVFHPPPTADQAAPPGPVVVYFHGSGWESGTVLQFAGHARLLARHGVTAAVAEYRIKERYQGTPFDSAADAKSAVRWLRKHAQELRIDPTKVVVAGGSAGGHIALATAIFQDQFDDPSDDLAFSARPNAMIGMAPIVDTTETGYRSTVPLFMGRERDLSPVHHLVAGLPPTLILLGTGDRWISREGIEAYRAGVQRLGGHCEVVLFEGRSHHFYNHPDYFELRPNLKSQDSPRDFVTSFYLIERFLFEQGITAKPPLVVPLPTSE